LNKKKMTENGLAEFSREFDNWFVIPRPTSVELQALKPNEVPRFLKSGDRLLFLNHHLRDVLRRQNVEEYEFFTDEQTLHRVRKTLEEIKHHVDVCKNTMRVMRSYSPECKENFPRAIEEYNASSKKIKHLIMRADKRRSGKDSLVHGLYYAMSGNAPPDRSAKTRVKRRVYRWLVEP